jgi:heat shock protein HtpX
MFTFLKRISLFLITNLAVLVLLGVVISVVNVFFPNLLSQFGNMWGILLYALVFGFWWAIISLFLSRWQAKKAYNIILLSPQTLVNADPRFQSVYETVERIAKDKNISMPEVGYYESPEPNAFATGATRNSALVAVSTGLLNNMKDNEIRGVVGHEMAHILNGDMVTLTLITGVLNTFVFVIAQVVSRIVAGFLSRDDENVSYFSYMMIYNLLQVVFWLLASLIIMWFSRVREYRADHGGAEFTGKSSMIAALRKLQSVSKLQPRDIFGGEKNMRAFMITEPDSMFSTHPSLDSRIKALEEDYKLA